MLRGCDDLVRPSQTASEVQTRTWKDSRPLTDDFEPRSVSLAVGRKESDPNPPRTTILQVPPSNPVSRTLHCCFRGLSKVSTAMYDRRSPTATVLTSLIRPYPLLRHWAVLLTLDERRDVGRRLTVRRHLPQQVIEKLCGNDERQLHRRDHGFPSVPLTERSWSSSSPEFGRPIRRQFVGSEACILL